MDPIVTCVNCGHQSRRRESPPGQQAHCPACFVPFGAKPASPSAPSYATKPLPPPNRTVLAETEAMIRYNCPRCKKLLESPASFAGEKLNCPDCNQRLQIPNTPPPPPSAPPINKTILASSEGFAPPPAFSSKQAGPPVFVEAVVMEETPAAAPAAGPRESCLECGVDVTKRSRVQTCPDCGSLLCSAQCYREHRYHSHDKRKKKSRPREAECEFCGSNARPYVTTSISEAGWILFAILLVFFFPLCWLGLLMTETRLKCRDCGARLE